MSPDNDTASAPLPNVPATATRVIPKSRTPNLRVPKSRKPPRSTLLAAAAARHHTQASARHTHSNAGPRARDAFGDKLPPVLLTGDAFEFELPDFVDGDEEGEADGR